VPTPRLQLAGDPPNALFCRQRRLDGFEFFGVVLDRGPAERNSFRLRPRDAKRIYTELVHQWPQMADPAEVLQQRLSDKCE